MMVVLRRSIANMFVAGLNAYLYVRFFPLVRLFVRCVGYWPNLANPRILNEKVSWRKLFDRNPCFSEIQDKLAARDFVKSRCPDIKLPQILWVGVDPNEIPFEMFDRPVVVKANHGCGYNYLIHDPSQVDRLDVTLFFTRVMGERWGADLYEWAYEEIEPKLYVEEMLTAEDGLEEVDYKVHVYDGMARFSHVQVLGRGQILKVYFDRAGNRLPVRVGHYANSYPFTKSETHDKADKLAEVLCEGFDALRVGFYVCDREIYFGEFTIYTNSGLAPCHPPGFDREMGVHWRITKSHYFTARRNGYRNFYRKCLEALSSPDDHAPVGLG